MNSLVENDKDQRCEDASVVKTDFQKPEIKNQSLQEVNASFSQRNDIVEKEIEKRCFINSCPKPWGLFTEPPPPPPSTKDFNPKPRGFLGTYISPYGSYVSYSDLFETEEL